MSSIESDLQKTSPSFCLAKWFQVSLLLQNGLGHSCHHPAPKKIPLEEVQANPSALHNHKKQREIRSEMLSGSRPAECRYCWNVEDSGSRSDRLFKSEEFWAHPYIHEARESLSVVPKYLEVSFSHLCNFKCAYCGPQSSSRWVEEAEKFGAFPTSQNFGDIEWFRKTNHLPFSNEEENPYVVAFWKWWPSIKNKLEVFRITGGEPLMSAATWKVMDDLTQEPMPNLRFAINSNLGVSETKIDRLIEKINALDGKVRNFTVFTSIDTGIPKHAEYLRFGMEFSLFKSNVERILAGVQWRVRLTMICTINALSMPGLLELLKWNHELRERYPDKSIGIDTPYLRYPDFLSLRILDSAALDQFKPCIEFMESRIEPSTKNSTKVKDWQTEPFIGFEEREVIRLRRVYDWAVSEITNRKNNKGRESRLRSDFKIFTEEYSKRRGLDFNRIFPDLKIHDQIRTQKTYASP